RAVVAAPDERSVRLLAALAPGDDDDDGGGGGGDDDDDALVAATRDGRLYCVRVAARGGARLAPLLALGERPCGVLFAPGGVLVAAGRGGRLLVLHGAADGGAVRHVEHALDAPLRCVAAVRDGAGAAPALLL